MDQTYRLNYVHFVLIGTITEDALEHFYRITQWCETQAWHKLILIKSGGGGGGSGGDDDDDDDDDYDDWCQLMKIDDDDNDDDDDDGPPGRTTANICGIDNNRVLLLKCFV